MAKDSAVFSSHMLFELAYTLRTGIQNALRKHCGLSPRTKQTWSPVSHSSLSTTSISSLLSKGSTGTGAKHHQLSELRSAGPPYRIRLELISDSLSHRFGSLRQKWCSPPLHSHTIRFTVFCSLSAMNTLLPVLHSARARWSASKEE